jgi:ABC-type polysaccharide/polyol phosphate export permease
MDRNTSHHHEEHPRPPNAREAAWQDLVRSLIGWRVWYLLGTNDARQRYRRSRIGQFWITINIAVFIICIGSINSSIFRVDISTYIPQFSVSYILWIFLSGLINDATTVFIQAEGILRQEPLPRLVLVYRVVLRHLVVLFHNALIIPVVFLTFGVPVGVEAAFALVGLVMVIVIGVSLVVLVGMACTRFRDLAQVVANLVTLLFFASPIMWRPAMLPADMAWLVTYNPVALMIRIVGEPIMGQVPPGLVYGQAMILAVGLIWLAAVMFVRFRARIVYWL